MLGVLHKEGLLGGLEFIDLTAHPERADSLGVKSVPWFRIGEFQFEGAMSPGQLRTWAQRAASTTGLQDYFFEMLKSGRRRQVEDMIRDEPQRAMALVELMRDPEASMAVRLGIGAVLEEFQGSAIAAAMTPELETLLQDADPRNRADAAHFLSLIGDAEAHRILRACLDHPDPAVREIAYDALSNPST